MVMRGRGRPLAPGSGRPQVSLTAPPPIHPPYRRPEQLPEPVHRARITRQGTAGREGGSPMDSSLCIGNHSCSPVNNLYGNYT